MKHIKAFNIALERAGRLNRELTFILVVLPFSATEIRKVVKHWGDVQQGIPTQCVVRSQFHCVRAESDWSV